MTEAERAEAVAKQTARVARAAAIRAAAREAKAMEAARAEDARAAEGYPKRSRGHARSPSYTQLHYTSGYDLEEQHCVPTSPVSGPALVSPPVPVQQQQWWPPTTIAMDTGTSAPTSSEPAALDEEQDESDLKRQRRGKETLADLSRCGHCSASPGGAPQTTQGVEDFLNAPCSMSATYKNVYPPSVTLDSLKQSSAGFYQPASSCCDGDDACWPQISLTRMPQRKQKQKQLLPPSDVPITTSTFSEFFETAERYDTHEFDEVGLSFNSEMDTLDILTATSVNEDGINTLDGEFNDHFLAMAVNFDSFL